MLQSTGFELFRVGCHVSLLSIPHQLYLTIFHHLTPCLSMSISPLLEPHFQTTSIAIISSSSCSPPLCLSITLSPFISLNLPLTLPMRLVPPHPCFPPPPPLLSPTSFSLLPFGLLSPTNPSLMWRTCLALRLLLSDRQKQITSACSRKLGPRRWHSVWHLQLHPYTFMPSLLHAALLPPLSFVLLSFLLSRVLLPVLSPAVRT